MLAFDKVKNGCGCLCQTSLKTVYSLKVYPEYIELRNAYRKVEEIQEYRIVEKPVITVSKVLTHLEIGCLNLIVGPFPNVEGIS